MPGLAALTGATGFIGRHIATRLLQDGWRLRVFSRNPEAHKLLPCEAAVIGDFTQPGKLAELTAGADLVIHCAGAIKARSRAEFQAANAQAVAALIDASRTQEDKPRFILLSTLAAREPEISAYAASKYAGELCAEERRDSLAALTILRPPAVYGPGDRETLAFFRMLRRGYAAIPKVEAARLSLIHVADLVEVVAALASAAEPPQGCFEVADPAPLGYSWQEMIAAGESAIGRRARRIVLPRPAAALLASTLSAAAKASGGLPMLNRDKVAELFHPDWVVRDRRLQEALRTPPGIGLAEGFRETAAWYRAHSWLKM